MTSTITPGAIPAGAWTVLAKGTGAIDITAIPTGYKFLRLMCLTVADLATGVQATFNADAGNHYYYIYAATHAESTTYIDLGRASTAQAFYVLDIINIPTAMKHTQSQVACYSGGVTANAKITSSGTWTNNTDEINRITVADAGTPTYWALFGAAMI